MKNNLDCFETLKTIENKRLQYVREIGIRLNFEFSDLDFGVEVIKMFAITEGAYKDSGLDSCIANH